MRAIAVIGRAVVVGMLVMLAGTIPRNLLFAANLHYYSGVPWAIPVTAAYLWFFWRFLGGAGPPVSNAEVRRAGLGANRVSARGWLWALIAGTLGIVALVLALRLVNTVVALPQQRLPDLSGTPKLTVLSLLLMAAPIAGIIEEAAFRGYMQRAIERDSGIIVAILVTGTMFGVAHLDFTPILWPYYVTVAAIYGTVTYLTGSILPAVVLHTAGNVYSNLDLWRHGDSEWQASGAAMARSSSGDASAWITVLPLVVVTAAMLLSFLKLARVMRLAVPPNAMDTTPLAQ